MHFIFVILANVLGESDQEIYDRIKKGTVFVVVVFLFFVLCSQGKIPTTFLNSPTLVVFRTIVSAHPALSGFENLDDRYPAEDWDSISSSAQDLINQMLTFKPHQRPSAGKCKDHEWITKQGPSIGLALHDAVMAKLVKFQNFNKFKQVAKRLIAETLDERDIAHLKEAFDEYDTDGDGSISISEMKNAIAKGGNHKLKNVDAKFLESLDIDGDGMIDYSEFLVATMRTKHWHTTERLRLAFDKLDVDSSGQLDRDEVRGALGGNDDALADQIINQFDVDGDGMISYDEFEAMMLSDAVEKLHHKKMVK